MLLGRLRIDQCPLIKARLMNHLQPLLAICFLFCGLSFPLQARAEMGWNNLNCCYEQPSCEGDANRFFARADVLCWKPNISGLELNFGRGRIVQTTVDEVPVVRSWESDKDPHFKWNAGYRIAAGYQPACSNWEIDALWTHFQGSGHSSNRDGCAWNSPSNNGKCRLKFNQLDVVLAYNSCMSDCLKFKPFIGIRGARIHESLNARSVTQIITADSSDSSSSSSEGASARRRFDDEQKFRGIGAILGLQGDWKIGCGFSLFGTAGVGVLYGVYKVEFDDVEVITSPFARRIFATNKRHLNACDCVLDLAFGVRWQTCLCDSFKLDMELGVEHHQYFNQNHLGARCGDLSLDGGFFSVGLVF